MAHPEPVAIGDLIIDASEHQRSFNISATVLESLVEKNIVTKDREERFTEAFKDPAKFMCVLLVTDKGDNFVFVPFKNKPNK